MILRYIQKFHWSLINVSFPILSYRCAAKWSFHDTRWVCSRRGSQRLKQEAKKRQTRAIQRNDSNLAGGQGSKYDARCSSLSLSLSLEVHEHGNFDLTDLGGELPFPSACARLPLSPRPTFHSYTYHSRSPFLYPRLYTANNLGSSSDFLLQPFRTVTRASFACSAKRNERKVSWNISSFRFWFLFLSCDRQCRRDSEEIGVRLLALSWKRQKLKLWSFCLDEALSAALLATAIYLAVPGKLTKCLMFTRSFSIRLPFSVRLNYIYEKQWERMTYDEIKFYVRQLRETSEGLLVH